jgi:hypothetical protein
MKGAVRVSHYQFRFGLAASAVTVLREMVLQQLTACGDCQTRGKSYEATQIVDWKSCGRGHCPI